MKDLVACLAKALMGTPEEVVLTETEGVYTSVIVLMAAKGDLARIIDQQGRTLRTMRAILGAALSSPHGALFF
jgi:predicted RNA-binding protein YlqC (UPF0109 family)